MKKLELHIHTVQTASNHPFLSLIEKLKQYEMIQSELLGVCSTAWNR